MQLDEKKKQLNVFPFCAINGDDAIPLVKKVNKYFSNVVLGGRGVIEMKLLNA